MMREESLRKSKMPQRPNHSATPRTLDFSLLRRATDTSEFVESLGRNKRSKVHVVFRQEILGDATEAVSRPQSAPKESISSKALVPPA